MLTEERVESIFREMDSYVLELIPDPTALGPQYFRDMIASCRNHLNRVSLVLTELDRERLAVSSELRKHESLYEFEYDARLANDDRVRSLSSIDDRRATVGFMLKDLRATIHDLKARMHVLDSVHKVVMFRNRELQATMTAIKDQKRAMQAEIRSGSFYGDERPGVATQDDVTAEELAQLLSGPNPDASLSVEAEESSAHDTPPNWQLLSGNDGRE